ncbi:MAG: hypothetical protein LBI57_02230 [Helicobacteraceae bacterium]|jgi:hypothetical protein|nr:hypothetical protein [Helicobacteraceae bacterium]
MREFFAIALIAINLSAIDWTHSEPFALRKDEFAVFEIDDNILTFKWSLFHNNGLVSLIKYDHFPYQTILYDDYKLNSIKIPIKTNKTAISENPYIMIVFDGFDSDRNISNMRLYLSDSLGTISVKKAFDERDR